MSEANRDSENGQFTAAEPPVGREAAEIDAGYVPYDDGKAAGPDLSVRELADNIADDRRAPESEIKTYSPLDDLPENTSFSPEQMAEIIGDHRKSFEDAIEAKEIEETRREVDTLRGEPPAAQEQANEAKTEQNDTPIESDDPDIAKALSKPKFVEAVKAYEGQLRQQATQAVEAANDFARLSFAENFPEIATLPPQQWESALVAMSQQEPERFKSAINSLNRVAQLQVARQQQQAQQQHREQVEFQNYAKAEDARFAELVKDEPPARMREIEAEIPQMLSELGVDPLEFLKAGNESRFLRTAAAQKVLVDAAKYRLINKAKVAVPSRIAPSVQRPGSSQNSSRASNSSAELSKRFASDPSAKNLAGIIGAMRRG